MKQKPFVCWSGLAGALAALPKPPNWTGSLGRCPGESAGKRGGKWSRSERAEKGLRIESKGKREGWRSDRTDREAEVGNGRKGKGRTDLRFTPPNLNPLLKSITKYMQTT